MINFLKNFVEKVKNKPLGYKIIFGLILVFYITIVLLALIKSNYYMLTPGKVTPVKSVIEIENYDSDEEVYTVSVFESRKISLLNYLLVEKLKIDKNVEVGKLPSVTMSNKNEDIKGLIQKQTSINQSIIVAYTEAQKTNPEIKLEYQFLGRVVLFLGEETDQNLQLEDIITHVDGTKVTNDGENPAEDFSNLIKSAGNKGKATLTVLRDGKIDGKINDDITKLKSHNVEVSLSNFHIGTLPFFDILEETVTPSYKINESSTQGPSGGLMQTIAIYNTITKSNLTKGKIVMGTGQININGNVDPIDGEKQKVVTAKLYSADIFFVPEENYADALEQYNRIKNPKFKLVKVKTFADALQELERLE